MKTVEEFIKEIENTDVLQNELKAVKDKNALAEFLKKNNVGAAVEEFVKAFKAKHETEGEINDDEKLEKVAGGFLWW